MAQVNPSQIQLNSDISSVELNTIHAQLASGINSVDSTQIVDDSVTQEKIPTRTRSLDITVRSNSTAANLSGLDSRVYMGSVVFPGGVGQDQFARGHCFIPEDYAGGAATIRILFTGKGNLVNQQMVRFSSSRAVDDPFVSDANFWNVEQAVNFTATIKDHEYTAIDMTIPAANLAKGNLTGFAIRPDATPASDFYCIGAQLIYTAEY